MSIELKLGRWRMRNGKTATVEDREGKPHYPWQGRKIRLTARQT